jgi:phage shock protein PspC (stress-responsive transcriptional regulator)
MPGMERGQLARSETDKRIAGVCAGIAHYFGIDPVLVRIGFVIAAFMGWGFLLYIVLWIVLPRGEATGTASSAAVWRGQVSPAVRIAEERFARGQISAEELEQIRQDLTRGA